jgi:peptide deformylase
MSKIEIIPDLQTPKVPDIDDIELFFIQNIKTLQAFKDYAVSRLDAAGLAANQVSIDGERLMLRVFAFRDLTTDKREPVWKLIINPRIREYFGMVDLKIEGCLTWCGRKIVASRHRGVVVDYYNELGEPVRGEIYTGFNAQVWQHEINHLDGIPETVVDSAYKLPPVKTPNRNDKCPCGSGKKYKQCCLQYECDW